jgi:hypothetical protein
MRGMRCTQDGNGRRLTALRTHRFACSLSLCVYKKQCIARLPTQGGGASMTGFYVALAIGVVATITVAVIAIVVVANNRVKARGTFLPGN